MMKLTVLPIVAAMALAGTGFAQVQGEASVKVKVGQTQRQNENIKVTYNGDLVAFQGQQPTMVGERVLVPLRGVFEKMGATVTWDASTDTVTAVKGDKTINLKIGDKQANVDGRMVTLDQPASLMHGRAMVPLRFLSESLGANVDWNASDMTVVITA